MKNSIKIFKALSDKNRLRIFKILQHKDNCCVCEICKILGVCQSTSSRHLSILENAGLIYSSKKGKWVNYHLTKKSKNKEVNDILLIVKSWLENDPLIKNDISKAMKIDRNFLCSS